MNMKVMRLSMIVMGGIACYGVIAPAYGMMPQRYQISIKGRTPSPDSQLVVIYLFVKSGTTIAQLKQQIYDENLFAQQYQIKALYFAGRLLRDDVILDEAFLREIAKEGDLQMVLVKR